MKLRWILFAFFLFGTFVTKADGLITSIVFSGPDDPSHQDIVQIQLEGGFSEFTNCNSSYSAIRNTETREAMISFALSAYLAKIPVAVKLNSNDKYFSDRCTISRIYAQ
ncbi:hypothetical protein R1T43_01320 [Alteromonas sp. CI.11.F.A3]|uniref:hypothetical protein n=1 Tax=Alteromonas sp. CI.11.F.A3 TaxID=3079555 RepID=UPI002941DA01|nr:hypothetical protein [Alteromonas sp. CI.11.F.A3]WOI37706.1 hypothetical protein R1T43_01320 [Alteromonas sp. CI.11.F.A3]